jgi:hypothetical protein
MSPGAPKEKPEKSGTSLRRRLVSGELEASLKEISSIGEAIGRCFRVSFKDLPVHRRVACIARLGKVGAVDP